MLAYVADNKKLLGLFDQKFPGTDLKFLEVESFKIIFYHITFQYQCHYEEHGNSDWVVIRGNKGENSQFLSSYETQKNLRDPRELGLIETERAKNQ